MYFNFIYWLSYFIIYCFLKKQVHIRVGEWFSSMPDMHLLYYMISIISTISSTFRPSCIVFR